MASRQGFLPRISVARPVTVVMLLTGILVVGFIAYTQIQIQFFPSGMENLRMHVWIPFPGATPHEVEQQLAAPVSEMMRTVKGLVRLTMYCTTSGLSCHLSFRNGTDMELAYNHLVDRLERLKPTLPDGVKKDNIGVWKWSGSEDWAMVWAGVSLNPDIQDTYRFMETHLARPLQRIDGVAKVDIRGTWRKSVVIELDQERARARGVNPYDLAEALRGDNFSIASGSIREGGRKFYVRSLAHYRDIEEIEDVRVGKGGNVRLREIANVFYDVPERGWRWRIDGQRAASLGIYRESGTNIVALCREIERTIREEIEKRPAMAGTTVELFFNQGKIIEESMENVEEAAVWGGIFAALVLFFFLRAIRMTLIVTLSIPLCALIAISSLYFMDWSLNVLTMMGLMLGIGIVVDDRNRDRGEHLPAAAWRKGIAVGRGGRGRGGGHSGYPVDVGDCGGLPAVDFHERRRGFHLCDVAHGCADDHRDYGLTPRVPSVHTTRGLPYETGGGGPRTPERGLDGAGVRTGFPVGYGTPPGRLPDRPDPVCEHPVSRGARETKGVVRRATQQRRDEF